MSEWLWHDLVAPTIAAGLGTVAGASIAFWVERHKRKVTQEDERVTATNIAIFALAQIWNDLESYQRADIEPQRTKPDRWYTLLPRPLPAPPSFDSSTLAYLFELPGEAPNLPIRVHFEISRYASICETATERNRIHNEEAQPALEKVNSTYEGTGPLRDRLIRYFKGPRVVVTLEGLTEDLVSMIDDSVASIPSTASDLRETAKALFPERQIIQFMRAPKFAKPTTS
jgi:hypothetical protein